MLEPHAIDDEDDAEGPEKALTDGAEAVCDDQAGDPIDALGEAGAAW